MHWYSHLAITVWSLSLRCLCVTIIPAYNTSVSRTDHSLAVSHTLTRNIVMRLSIYSSHLPINLILWIIFVCIHIFYFKCQVQSRDFLKHQWYSCNRFSQHNRNHSQLPIQARLSPKSTKQINGESRLVGPLSPKLRLLHFQKTNSKRA